MISITLVTLLVSSPLTFAKTTPDGQRLGTDLPFLALADPSGRLTVQDIAELPPTAFKRYTRPLNQGYTRDVFWLRIDAPPGLTSHSDSAWLELLPTYIDEVTVYQQTDGTWHAQHRGDIVPKSEQPKEPTLRPLVFSLNPAQGFILRVATVSPMQVNATVWSTAGLLGHRSASEWASGLLVGVNLATAMLIIGAALALRMRRLTALAVTSAACLLHTLAIGGYLTLWLPDSLRLMGDFAAKAGFLSIPSALAWQYREVLTIGTKWRWADRFLLWLGLVPLLCVLAVPISYFTEVAWLGVSAPWGISLVAAWVAWCNLIREEATLERMLMVLPSTAYALVGVYVTFTYLGWAPVLLLETSVMWQLNIVLANIVVATAVGAGLVRRFRESVVKLARSEQSLDERVRQRTAELLKARNALRATLHSERMLREEQRQFFDMVNHEFRTPLTIIDSAATEQATFPTPDADTQIERAFQIRRASRRLTALVENCLVSERLEGADFGLQLGPTQLPPLIEESAQLVRWSSRHRLKLNIDTAPAIWICDATLVQMALSNLVDNAVKYAKAGDIEVSACYTATAGLELSVSDDGPGLPPELVQSIFERFERGAHMDQARGFGLGLWVARRVAQLHGGDVRLEPSAKGGTRFTLIIPQPI